MIAYSQGPEKGERRGQCPGAALLVKRRNSWWWKVVVVVVGGRHFSTRPGAALPHVGTLPPP